MNTEVISKAAYSNGLQENGQDGVVFTMPASRKKFMSVYIRPDIDTLVFSRKFIEYNLILWTKTRSFQTSGKSTLKTE